MQSNIKHTYLDAWKEVYVCVGGMEWNVPSPEGTASLILDESVIGISSSFHALGACGGVLQGVAHDAFGS